MPTEAPGAAPPPPAPTVVVSVELPIGGRPFRARLNVPASRCRPGELLPLFHTLADAFVQAAVEQAATGGQAVSCAKGCASCCRHLVPVSEVEVRRLRAAIDRMAPAARGAVLDRFAAARTALQDSGLLPRLDQLDDLWDDDLVALIRDYYRRGIACPLLEDGACQVYADRPAACREHLVTSPAARCADPAEAGVARLPMPREVVSRALRCFNTDPAFGRKGWRPLVPALDAALARPAEPEPAAGTGPELLQRFFERLSGEPVRTRSG